MAYRYIYIILLFHKYFNILLFQTVMRTEFDEECEDEEGEEKCRTEFDYVCEEAKPKPTYAPPTYAPPSAGYGIPRAPPLSAGTYGLAYGPTSTARVDETEDELPEYTDDELPEYR